MRPFRNRTRPPSGLLERGVSACASPSRDRHRHRHRARRRGIRMRRRDQPRRGRRRLPQDADVLGFQPGAERRGGQEDPRSRAEEVRAADRDQGQAGGRSPGPTCSTGSSPPPPRARARMCSTSATPGPLRSRPPARCSPGTTRTSTRSADVTASLPPPWSHGRGRQGPGRGTAVLAGLRALLQQADVQGRRASANPRPPGTSWSRTARGSPRTASGAWAPRAAS